MTTFIPNSKHLDNRTKLRKILNDGYKY